MSQPLDYSTQRNGPVRRTAVVPSTAGPAAQLQHFCEGILNLLQAGPDSSSVLASVIPGLLQAIRAGNGQTVAELGRDLRAWQAAYEQLSPLADSPFFGADAAIVLAKLERTHAQALRVVQVLEALPFASSPPAAGEPPGGIAADRDDGPRPEPILRFPIPAVERPLLPDPPTPPESASSPPRVARPESAQPRRVREGRSCPDSALATQPLEPTAAEVPSTPASEPPPDRAEAPAGGRATPVAANQLTVRCPACGKTCAIRWDKLQPGKVLGCPHCRGFCTSKLDGQLVVVAKDKNGRWKDPAKLETRKRWVRLRPHRLAAGALAAVLLGTALVGTASILHSSSTDELQLPRELTPRAELFARAWLKQDFFLMRQMTDPDQDRKLFPWSKRNRPPTTNFPEGLANDLKVNVEVLPSQLATTLLRIRFDGLRSGPKGKPVELQLAWKKRAGNWFFQPVPDRKMP